MLTGPFRVITIKAYLSFTVETSDLKFEYWIYPKHLVTYLFNILKVKLWTSPFYNLVKFVYSSDGIANSVNPDQTAPKAAVWSG